MALTTMLGRSLPAAAAYLTVLTLAAMPVAPALAQGEPVGGGEPALPEASTDLQFELSAGAWLPRLGGRSGLESSAGTLNLLAFEGRMRFDDLEPTVAIDALMRRRNRWELRLRGFDFSARASNVASTPLRFGDLRAAPGDRFRGTMDITSVSAEFAYARFRPYETGDVSLRFWPLASARFIDVDQTFATGGERVGAAGEWLAVSGGLQLELDYDPAGSWGPIDRMELFGALAVGPALGGDGGFVLHTRAGISLYCCDDFAFTFAFQLLHLDVEDGPYRVEGDLQGLFFGATMKF